MLDVGHVSMLLPTLDSMLAERLVYLLVVLPLIPQTSLHIVNIYLL